MKQSKIVLVSDLHMGCHKNNPKFLESQLAWFKDEFIPYLKEQDITTIVILGDVFDNRQSLNTLILKSAYERLFKVLNENKFQTHVIIGNHDTYYSTSIDVHSMPFLDEFENIHLYDKITKVNILGKDCMMIPWQVDPAYVQTLTKADYCFGHLEINGFNMYKFKIAESITGEMTFLNNFKHTFSGHFHTRSEKDKYGSKITYIGSPYQLTRNDAEEERGFVVLDVEKDEYEYINNKNSIKFVTLKYPEEFTESMIKNNVVDVIVEFNDTYNEEKFDEYIKKVEKFNPVFPPNKRIINNFLENNSLDNIDQMKNYSIEQIIDEYLKSITCENKEKIHLIVNSLLTECKDSFI